MSVRLAKQEGFTKSSDFVHSVSRGKLIQSLIISCFHSRVRDAIYWQTHWAQAEFRPFFSPFHDKALLHYPFRTWAGFNFQAFSTSRFIVTEVGYPSQKEKAALGQVTRRQGILPITCKLPRTVNQPGRSRKGKHSQTIHMIAKSNILGQFWNLNEIFFFFSLIIQTFILVFSLFIIIAILVVFVVICFVFLSAIVACKTNRNPFDLCISRLSTWVYFSYFIYILN